MDWPVNSYFFFANLGIEKEIFVLRDIDIAFDDIHFKIQKQLVSEIDNL